MTQNLQPGFDSGFPFADNILLSTAPMTDAEFAAFVKIKNDEIPIERVGFNHDSQP